VKTSGEVVDYKPGKMCAEDFIVVVVQQSRPALDRQTDKTMMMPSNLSLSLFLLFLFSVILISGLIVFFSLLRSADSSLPLSQEKKMESKLKIKPIKILKP
jgi:hypothetical protein